MKQIIFLFLIALSNAALAEVVDLQKFQTEVKDQKDRNTCAYFAVTALMESSIKAQFGLDLDLSEQFQISHGKEHYKQYSNKEYGSTYEILLNFRNQGFLITEDHVPYQLSYFEKGRPCEQYDPFDESAPVFCFSHGPIAWQELPRYRTGGINIDHMTGLWSPGKNRVNLIEDALRKNRAVVITLKVYAPLWDYSHVTYPKEIDEQCTNGELECYGHAILLTGFDSDKKTFKFKNSWGTSWGDQGYGTIDYDYVLNYSDMPLSIFWDRMLGEVVERKL